MDNGSDILLSFILAYLEALEAGGIEKIEEKSNAS
jgi:hypothetical protein